MSSVREQVINLFPCCDGAMVIRIKITTFSDSELGTGLSTLRAQSPFSLSALGGGLWALLSFYR